MGVRLVRAVLMACVVTAFVGVFSTTAASADPGNGQSAEHANENSKVQETVSANQETTNAGTSGDPTEPQPLSTADDNGTGANQSGPYDSTRDGAPSLNGNGNGEATGKPCAGCVGKADNKNPHGQLPGPQDHNHGYECDSNHGIGKSNPAHTGCTNSPPQECNPEVEDCNPGCDASIEDCNPGCDATVEQCGPPADVLGVQITRDPVVEGEALARTGIDFSDEVTFAALMLVMGACSILASRKLQHRHI
jgi:hypothetical protein